MGGDFVNSEISENSEGIDNFKNQSKDNVENKPYQCLICQKYFSTNNLLKNHTIEVHKIPFFRQRRKNETGRICDICEAKYLHINELKRHIRQVHKGKFWTFKCDKCEFEEAKNLNDKINQNEETRRFKCYRYNFSSTD